jgi:choline dehydrogenase-like flavoprotein
MVSGIGNKDIIEKAGIEFKVKNNEIGRNLQDHPSIGMTFQIKDTFAASYPSLYSFANTLGDYMEKIHSSKETNSNDNSNNTSFDINIDGFNNEEENYIDKDNDNNNKKKKTSFGILGSAGLSVGGFLVSPYCGLDDVADLQLTVFPSVTEPHIVNRYL